MVVLREESIEVNDVTSMSLRDCVGLRVMIDPWAYNEGLVERLRVAMQDEQRASNQGDLMIRVDPAALEQLLDEPQVARMEMGGRLMKGWVRVTAPTVEADAGLRVWVDRGPDYARSLPAK